MAFTFDDINVKNLIRHAEDELLDKYIVQWSKELESHNKLRTYCLFKNKYKVDNYVTMNLTKACRSCLAKLSGTLPTTSNRNR